MYVERQERLVAPFGNSTHELISSFELAAFALICFSYANAVSRPNQSAECELRARLDCSARADSLAASRIALLKSSSANSSHAT